MKRGKGQVWVETVIYTLIGLAIMGIILAVVKPSIDAKKDQTILSQSEELLRNIKTQVEDVRYYGAGNSRVVELSIKKGELKIDSENDWIVFSMDSKYQYSELDKEVGDDIKILTTGKDKNFKVSLRLDYSNVLNVTYSSQDKEKTFTSSPTNYKLNIANNGRVGNFMNIDFSSG
ncbi:MAG: hypothetical protein NT076_01170 [Candidatus Pacearchaeota archaeon]|nr:hypothetical protein [Candidatus Pacearchaeota archaeon]